jgi:alpha-mannosidase
MSIDADITTYVTLSDNIARVDFKTVVTNRAENHRLRALFTTNLVSEHVNAEGQFDIVKRDITPSPMWKNPCNAQRMQAFVTVESENGDKNALMVATRGLCEYEALRDGHNTVALTLLRCVGEIGDWGVFPTPLGQKKGTWTLEYSLIPYDVDNRVSAYREGYTFAYPSVVAIGTEKHSGAQSESEIIAFDNEYIRMTALKKAENSDNVIFRAFNTTDKTQPLTVTVADTFKKAYLTNLAEERIEEIKIKDGKISLEVPKKKIFTVELI